MATPNCHTGPCPIGVDVDYQQSGLGMFGHETMYVVNFVGSHHPLKHPHKPDFGHHDLGHPIRLQLRVQAARPGEGDEQGKLFERPEKSQKSVQ